MKILILVAVWAMMFTLAFIVPRLIEPTGDGFTRGMNRLPAAIGLQCLAFCVAAVTAGLSFTTREELAKWILVTGFIPLVIQILLVGSIFIFLFSAMVFNF